MFGEHEKNVREETFEKPGTPRVVVLFFPKFWKLLVYFILEVAGNLNRRFWLNGICKVGGRVEEWQGFFQVLKYVTPLTTLLIFSEI